MRNMDLIRFTSNRCYIQMTKFCLLWKMINSFFFPALSWGNFINHNRVRIESVLLKSHVLSEVQRSMLEGGMRVEDLPGEPSPQSGPVSPHLGQHSPERFRDSYSGTGGPAGLWHFIYRSIYLDQYVSSEFSSAISTPQQQKRYATALTDSL